MTTSTRPYPPPRMRYGEHITAPRRAWHENPLRVLLFRVQRMKLNDEIEHNGYTITKDRNASEGIRWHVHKDGTEPRMFRDAAQAVDVVTAADSGQQETHKQDNEE